MSINILIADDEYFIRKRIIKIIDWEGLNLRLITEAENGKDAIKTLRENRIDIALLDIKMPILSGLDVAKFISNKSLKTQIIILSGYPDFEYARRAIDYNVMQYLVKPIDTQTLNECLKKAIKQIEKNTNIENTNELLKKDIRPSDKRLVDKICEYIDKNYKDSSLNVQILANDFSLHPSYINSVFKKNIGTSILSYINGKRLEYAKKLIEESDISIKEIAIKSGFNDAFYFSKKFKAKYDVSPSRIRKIM